MKTLSLTGYMIKNIMREWSMIFSTLILPALILWSTWWVTADIPMIFNVQTSDVLIQMSMIDVHVVTGGLTAIAITSSIFGYVIVAENRRTNKRLETTGYPPITITLSMLLSLLVTLSFTTLLVIIAVPNMTEVKSAGSYAVAVVYTTLIYAVLGTVVGELIQNTTEGTLVLLIFSFMDLMLLSNPMGGGVYLDSWTYYLPGFWPVQIALHASFVGDVGTEYLLYPLSAVLALIVVTILTKIILGWRYRY